MAVIFSNVRFRIAEKPGLGEKVCEKNLTIECCVKGNLQWVSQAPVSQAIRLKKRLKKQLKKKIPREAISVQQEVQKKHRSLRARPHTTNVSRIFGIEGAVG